MFQLIEALVERSCSAIPSEKGDYLVDGLLYCGKCRTPKQIAIQLGDKLVKPHVLCKCEKDKADAAEAERKAREFAERVDRLRKGAFSERMMTGWTFANDDGANEKITGAMHRYVEHFDDFKSSGKGLLLYGSVGTGKTYAACEVANALIDKGIPCMVTNFARIANTMQGMFDGRQEYLDSFSRYALLVIDDLGAERKSDFMLETVFNVIDARYRSGLPMIITTNLPIEAIKSPPNDQFARIYDRVLERCFPVEVSGKSRRRAAIRADYEDVKEVLGL